MTAEQRETFDQELEDPERVEREREIDAQRRFLAVMGGEVG